MSWGIELQQVWSFYWPVPTFKESFTSGWTLLCTFWVTGSGLITQTPIETHYQHLSVLHCVLNSFNSHKFWAAKIHLYALSLNLRFTIQNDDFAPKVAPRHPHQSQRLIEALEFDTFTALNPFLWSTLSYITLKWNLGHSIISSISKASSRAMNAWQFFLFSKKYCTQ